MPAELTQEEAQLVKDVRSELLKSEFFRNDLPACDAVVNAIILAVKNTSQKS